MESTITQQVKQAIDEIILTEKKENDKVILRIVLSRNVAQTSGWVHVDRLVMICGLYPAFVRRVLSSGLTFVRLWRNVVSKRVFNGTVFKEY